MQHRRRVSALSTLDRDVLELERTWGGGANVQRAKFADAQSRLGLSPHAYVLILRALVDDPTAEQFAPDVIARLRQSCLAHASEKGD